jgi:uncharacterized protein (TIGR02646 family)
MKNIYKSPEPKELEKYRERFSKEFRRWNDLKKNKKTLIAIRDNLEKDQKGLCAYCEIELNETNRSVEHFIPCNQSTLDNNYDLQWSNLLAVCLPPGSLIDTDLSQVENLDKVPCCGKKKDNFVPNEHFLNPLNLPSLSLFTVSLTGEIKPNIVNCKNLGILVEYVQLTIDRLGLNVSRLQRLRSRTIQEVIKKREQLREVFADKNISEIDLEIETSQIYFGDGTENWPRFFTTIRWVLKDGAEQYLKEISYTG